MQIDPNRQPLIDNRKETHMMVELKMLKAMADGAMTMAAQAEQMARSADGVIVGSAIVKLIAQYGKDAVPYVGEYVEGMKEAANRES